MRVVRRAAAIFVAAAAVGGALGYGLAYHGAWISDTLRGPEARTELVARPCGFTTESGRAMACYDLHVPENRARKGSRLITLPIIVFKASETPLKDDPVLLIGGGPGAIAYTERRHAAMWRDKFKDLDWLKGRDLIVYDQRGVGGARPALECPEIDATRADPLDVERSRKAMIACRDRLAQEGVDLVAYDTNANADDIASLRATLGVRQWTLWGQSYGTRVALTYMRRNPPDVRAVILDGAYPPEIAGKLHLATAFLASVERVFDACAKSAECQADYPDLRHRYAELLKRLRAKPIHVKSDPAPVLAPKIFRVDDVIFLSVVDSMLYTADGIAKLPWLIDRLADGKDDALEEPLVDFDLVAYGPYVTAGVSYLVDCNDTPDPDDSEEKRIAAREPLLSAWLGYTTAYKPCTYWAQRKQPALDRTPVTSDIPTLVLAGWFDLATPPEWGALAARSLPRAQFVLVRAASHDASDQDCARSALGVFIDKPTADLTLYCGVSPSHPNFKRKSESD